MRFSFLVLVMFVLISLPLRAQVEQDKVLHFGIGALTGAAGAFVASELSNQNRFWTVTGAIATSLLAGIAKEAYDERQSNSWDNADLGATVLGGITVGVTIELFSKKNGNSYQSKLGTQDALEARRLALETYFRAETPSPVQSLDIAVYE